MNKQLLEILDSYKSSEEEIKWDSSLIRRNGCGHTYEGADLQIVRSGPDTAVEKIMIGCKMVGAKTI